MTYQLTTLKDGVKANAADIIIRIMQDRDKHNNTRI